MSDLQSLIERVEKATGPDRDLDQDLYDLVWLGLEQAREVALPNCPKFTASIDAALSLVSRVLPGWRWTVTSDGRKEGVPRAWLWIERRWIEDSDLDPPMLRNIDAEGSTPALAICLALLKAVQAQANNDATEETRG